MQIRLLFYYDYANTSSFLYKLAILRNHYGMSFKENLKGELKYRGMLVKELAAKSGIPKGTIDHYLAEKNTEPVAENAVKIAQALGVSVEYLVTGKNPQFSNTQIPYNIEIRSLVSKLSQLNTKQFNLAKKIIDAIQKEI